MFWASFCCISILTVFSFSLGSTAVGNIMSKEMEMKEVELNELDQEKQPMTGETPEKNGCVKVKVPEDAEVKFTGLSKEELMRVAGTTGYELLQT